MSDDSTQESIRDKARVMGWESQPGFSRVNIMIKIIIIKVLKHDLGIDPGYDQGHELGWSLTQVNVKIKVVIITVLKLDLGVDQAKARVTSQDGQPKLSQDKSSYYYSFKTRLGGRPGQGSGHKSRWSTQVEPSQYKNKNDYYHSFKTQLEG